MVGVFPLAPIWSSSVPGRKSDSGVKMYNGLESRILNSCSYDEESGASAMTGGDGCVTADSLDEEVSSCFSSKDITCDSSSFSSHCLLSRKQEENTLDELDTPKSLHNLCSKEKEPITYSMIASDVEAMKEKFARLLLGEDVSGGTKGLSTALALSNAISNLSATVFGELWKLEPLSEDKKIRWHREMEWLLSPTNYMVELVPSQQNGANGGMLEIMIPKARSDVHVNLPALQKLDSMLIEVLDSMVDTEFWYAECGSREEGRSRNAGPRANKKWWLPSPRVPDSGLSHSERKRLVFKAKLVHQVLKAAKTINEQVLLQMPIPPTSGRVRLGEDIYQAITAECCSTEEIFVSFKFTSEHRVLETVNRLEGAVLTWKQKISDEMDKRSPIRYPWHILKDNVLETEKMVLCTEKVEALLQHIKSRYPNLPQTFIEVIKVKYNKDIAHSIVEAYSRVLVGLAFSILSRIGDILIEDDLKKPTTPIATLKFDFCSDVYLSGITETPPGHIKRSLIYQMNMVDGRTKGTEVTKGIKDYSFDKKSKMITVIAASPLRNKACIKNSST
ncbi:Rop guanine nucleotide exchange factor 14 [Ananas comosus]|uniref:Rop guanine nucleotide exchange factor 14 n=1 Tax=Ananas comosus TaxID=4615 RepID=A0A199V9H1_ANACO|nr:Rop guanine nucleotide exchange factor 14 [Ananas comosus]